MTAMPTNDTSPSATPMGMRAAISRMTTTTLYKPISSDVIRALLPGPRVLPGAGY